MKTLIYAFLGFGCLIQNVVGNDLSFDLVINVDKIKVVGSITANSPISVFVDKRLEKKDGDFKRYKCKLGFSREPTAQEIKRVQLSVLAEAEDEPLGFGTTYAEVLRKDLQSAVWKVQVVRGRVRLPLKVNPDERMICAVTSGGGYFCQRLVFADQNGTIDFDWEATSGRSVIKLVKFDDLMKHAKDEKKSVWNTWEFFPSANGGETKFRKK